MCLNRRNFAINLLAVCVYFCGLAPVSAQEDGGAGGNSEAAVSVQPDTVAVSNVANSEQIESRLRSILDATQWFEDTRVESVDGVVTLSGKSDSEEHRQWAEQLAMRTQDVVSVRNEIEVETAIDFSSSWNVIGQSLTNLWQDFLRRSPLFIAAILVVLLTWGVARLSAAILEKFLIRSNRIRQSLKDLLSLLCSIGVWIAGLLIAAVVAFPGMTPARALAVLGLGSVAIGFAFKDIFENFFAGVLILWKYPLDRGDIVEIGSVKGRVEEITVRNTLIRKLNGELTVVPNANIFKQEVDVLTNRSERRVQLTCGIAYSEDIDRSRKVILEAVRGCSTVSTSNDIHVLADCFADSSINFEVFWWTKAAPMEIRKSRDQVVTAIKRELDAAGIEIPFPYRTLTFKDSLHVQQAVAAD